MLRSRATYVFGQSRALLRGTGEATPFRATASCLLLTGCVRHQSSSLPFSLHKVGKDIVKAEEPIEGIKCCTSKGIRCENVNSRGTDEEVSVF
jgi:hypothetical protein